MLAPMRKVHVAIAAILALVLQASSCDTGSGGGGSSSGGSHTYTPTFKVNCDRRALSLGDTVEPILSVRNSTDQSWGSTFVWVQGDSDFRIEDMAMNGQQADDTYRSAGQWGLGSLSA